MDGDLSEARSNIINGVGENVIDKGLNGGEF